MSHPAISCRTEFHRLPPFWDRRAVFIANILSIFFGNREEVSELRREVGTLESYGGRLIPVLDLLFSKKDNLLVLEQAADSCLLEYFLSLGLTLPRTCVIPEDFFRKYPGRMDAPVMEFLDRLRAEPASWLAGYVTDASLAFMAHQIGKEILGTPEACQRGNNKLLLHDFLEGEGLGVFDTAKASDRKTVLNALETFRQQGYREAVIKAQIGASGVGMIRIAFDRPLPEGALPDYLFYAGPVLVQGWLDGQVLSVRLIASPSVQLFLDEKTCWIYDLTEQILSRESVHEGNVAPPPCFERYPQMKGIMLEQASRVGAWLGAQGYQGTASIDYHSIERAGRLEVRVCEVNARVTGATYPAVLARRLMPGHAWLMRNVRFARALKGEKILERMQASGLLFETGKQEGVLPINFNLEASGQAVKGQFLFLAGKPDAVTALLLQLKELFSDFGDFDRD